ncbi:MAG: hypothetical protein JHC33_07810 [Ignisphaera sp.]|nr:hypothetical protein [Ignisphaera sp.]
MIPFKEFDDLLQVVEFIYEKIDFETSLYKEILEDFIGVPKSLAQIEDKLVAILEQSTNADGLVEWYVYDTRFGSVPLELSVNGIKRIVDSNERLYEVLKELNEVTTDRNA